MVHISEREIQLPDAVISKLLCIAAEDKNVISLSIGQPDFSAPKPLLEYTKKVAEKSTRYSPTEGYMELRESLAKKLRKENKIKCNYRNVLVGTGSQEMFISAFSSVLDVTEEVVLPNPCYMAYIPQIELVHGVARLIPIKQEDNWAINTGELKKLIDKKKTKIILINSPANPTGGVLTRKNLEEIADVAREFGLYIFSDEAYEKLVYEKKHISVGSLNGMDEHAVTFQSFSKSYAMCGYRLGYACGPEKLINAMSKVSHYITLAPPSLSQRVALKALTLSRLHIEKMRKEYDRRRRYTVKRLNELGLKTNMPYGAFYAFANIKHLSSNSFKFADVLLKKAKVAVVPGTEFGRYGEGFIRVSYATDIKLIEKGLDRIEKFLKKYR